MPGGRLLFRKKPGGDKSTITLEPVITTMPPGQRVAAPGDGISIDASYYTRGTSNATALASRGAALIHEALQDLQENTGLELIHDEHIAVLLKALLVHGSSWESVKEELSTLLEIKERSIIGRYLGYGPSNIERVLSCTKQRATMLGWGTLSNEQADCFSIQLPPCLNAVKIWRRLIITLAWFTPINPRNQLYRQASLWFSPYGTTRQEGSCLALLGLMRQDADNRATQRGTIQHEVFAGENATTYPDGAEIKIQVNCREDAGKLRESIPYGLIATLEVAPNINLPIYEEVKERIKPRISVTEIT
jgi:hypothetical protein